MDGGREGRDPRWWEGPTLTVSPLRFRLKSGRVPRACAHTAPHTTCYRENLSSPRCPLVRCRPGRRCSPGRRCRRCLLCRHRRRRLRRRCPWLTPADTSPQDPRSFSVVLSATCSPHPAPQFFRRHSDERTPHSTPATPHARPPAARACMYGPCKILLPCLHALCLCERYRSRKIERERKR